MVLCDHTNYVQRIKMAFIEFKKYKISEKKRIN